MRFKTQHFQQIHSVFTGKRILYDCIPHESKRYRSVCAMARIKAICVRQDSVYFHYRVVLRGVRRGGMEEVLNVFSLLGN